MDGKNCFKCNQWKPIDCFYRHPQMADGRVNKCKECNKSDVRANYIANRDAKLEYEKVRNKREERRSKKSIYHQRHKLKYPEKYIARVLVGNALRDGKMSKMPCAVCGCQKAEAHHDDYSKPLDVMWLCHYHHRMRHGTLASMALGEVSNFRSLG